MKLCELESTISPEIFHEGSTLPYLGVNYPFRIINGQKENVGSKNVKLVNGEFLIFARGSRLSKKCIESLYEEWLLEQAKYTFDLLHGWRLTLACDHTVGVLPMVVRRIDKKPSQFRANP